MKREDKSQLIETLTEQLQAAKYLYITDISDMNSENTSKLRRLCFKREVELVVVKNSLLQKAMEKSGKDFGPLYDVLKGHTSIMMAEQGLSKNSGKHPLNLCSKVHTLKK
jgi:large subunit ribosomal protein L10